jgi:hypothetical protein
MKRTITIILILCLTFIAISRPKPHTNAQATSDAGNAYGLGVSMGFASFQATTLRDRWGDAYWEAVKQARQFAHLVQGAVPELDPAPLRVLDQEFVNDVNARIDTDAKQGSYYSRVLALRGQYSSTLHQATKQLGNAYDLGVAISIAEGQATVGEPARGIVRSSLVNAQALATNLGVSTSELAGIILQIDQGVAVNGIYGQVTQLRGKYQALLSSLKPSINKVPQIVTGKPTRDADTDLLQRGCTRPAVGTYKCPTIGGYEACETYRKIGKVQACSTSANEKVQAAMDKLLFSVGCSRFLNRPDEFLCKTQKGLDLCETYHKNGKLKKCMAAK